MGPTCGHVTDKTNLRRDRRGGGARALRGPRRRDAAWNGPPAVIDGAPHAPGWAVPCMSQGDGLGVGEALSM